MRAEKRRVGLRETLVGIVITLFTFASATAGEEKDTVADGNRVSIEYTLTLPDKTQVDTNVGMEPLTYTQGGKKFCRVYKKRFSVLRREKSRG